MESSCEDAELKSGSVDVNYNGVLSENSVTFNDGKKFGLPENHVGTSSGMITMEGETRTCRAPLWSKKTTKLLFLCHSNSDPNESCHVYIHK